MTHRIIPTQETWLAIAEWANVELARRRKLLERESTPLEKVPCIRAEIRLLNKLLNQTNEPEEKTDE